MKKYHNIRLFGGILLFLSSFLLGGKEVVAQTYTDSLTFKIDSARVEGDFLVYSVMFWRTNQDWSGGGIHGVQDTILSHTDLYFWLEDVVFDQNTVPQIVRKHPKLNFPTDGTKPNLIDISTGYYARRYQISLRLKSGGSGSSGVVSVLWNKPVELCKIKMRMKDPAQNPGLRWDTLATGGQSTIQEPLILTLEGDILSNPAKDIQLKDHSKTVYACQGGEAKIWAKGHSAGSDLQMSWYMSEEKDCRAAYRAGNGVMFTSDVKGNLVSGQVHYVGSASSKWGQLFYKVTCTNDLLERVDTLTISNVPAGLDSIYFQCELSDPSLTANPVTSVAGKTQLLLRDSLFGWFAASDPSMRDDGITGIGASDRTDTVMKCPDVGAVISFYFFGPECGEDKEVIGNKMEVEYQWQDALGNTDTGLASLNSWEVEPGIAAPNSRCLYKGTLMIGDSIKDKNVWIRSIATENGCRNGASYSKYDTVYIREIEPDQTVRTSVTDTVLAIGESFVLKPTFNYTPSLLVGTAGGTITSSGGKYTYKAPAVSCSDVKGCADTILYTYTINNGNGTTCRMEVEQTVRINTAYYLSLKVLLEGGFVFSSSSTMYSDLAGVFERSDAGLFKSPYTKESCAVVPNIGGKIIDWVYIELRDASNVGHLLQIVDSVSAFLREDGVVCGMDGKPYVSFKNLKKSDYHVIVEHRNHLGIMSKDAISLKTSAMDVVSNILIDFTVAASNYVDAGVSSVMPYVTLPDGRVAMHLGDVDKDGMIGFNDANLVLFNPVFGFYSKYDINFDIDANFGDYNEVHPKFLSGNPVQHY